MAAASAALPPPRRPDPRRPLGPEQDGAPPLRQLRLIYLRRRDGARRGRHQDPEDPAANGRGLHERLVVPPTPLLGAPRRQPRHRRPLPLLQRMRDQAPDLVLPPRSRLLPQRVGSPAFQPDEMCGVLGSAKPPGWMERHRTRRENGRAHVRL